VVKKPLKVIGIQVSGKGGNDFYTSSITRELMAGKQRQLVPIGLR
jgi:hypothetical protein